MLISAIIKYFEQKYKKYNVARFKIGMGIVKV